MRDSLIGGAATLPATALFSTLVLPRPPHRLRVGQRGNGGVVRRGGAAGWLESPQCGAVRFHRVAGPRAVEERRQERDVEVREVAAAR